jgi:Two component regulator propeller
MKRPIFLILLFCIHLIVMAQAVAIEQWREHLSFNQAYKLSVLGGNLFCTVPAAVFSIDSNNEVQRYHKINTLNDVGVQTIASDAATNQLIIAYNNSNIDILKGNKVLNITAIKNAAISGDKKINSFYVTGGKAYAAAGIGIFVIDLTRYEVSNTYIIGAAGNTVNVNAVTADANFLYAATTEGLKKVAVAGINQADYKNWQLVSGTNGLQPGPVATVLTNNNAIIAQRADSLFILNNNNWQLLYADGWRIINATASAGKIVLCQQNGINYRVTVITNTGSVESVVQHPKIAAPQQAVFFNNGLWLADAVNGLLSINGSNVTALQPNSPAGKVQGGLTIKQEVLWAASGTVTANFTNTFNGTGLYQLVNNEWKNINATVIPAMDSLYDFNTVAMDPEDQSVWAGSFGGGLCNIKSNNSIQVFKQNSFIEPSLANPSFYRVAGLAFDNNHNLWITNYGAANNLVVKKADGSWKKIAVPYALTENAVAQIVTDDFNQVWIRSPKNNGLICYNSGSSIDNIADDRWKLFRAGKGNGNLPDNNVLCIAKDKNNFIWVGTAKGIGIIPCAQQLFTNNSCEAVLPIVQQDNFAGYLFRDEEVQCIAVDGANRKWVGTKNGVWLLSEDAEKIIYRFTQSNSPLLADDVLNITIDEKNGDVYFATANGLCSFRSTATEARVTENEVLVFPNPVPPGYNGTIAIRGLPENSIVKITELNGRLVHQTRSLGGQAVWNGKNYKGQTISTGVYLVLVSNESRQDKLVSKIVFIAK